MKIIFETGMAIYIVVWSIFKLHMVVDWLSG